MHFQPARVTLRMDCKKIWLAVCLFLLINLLNEAFCLDFGFIMSRDAEKSNIEHCYYEDLKKHTFVLVNTKSKLIGAQAKFQKPDPTVKLQFAVTEYPIGGKENVLLTQIDDFQSGRFFFTSSSDGEHKICFKAIRTDDRDNRPIAPILTMFEFLFGNAGNPDVVSHTEANLGKLEEYVSYLIEQANIIRHEQDRLSYKEQEFRSISENINYSIKLILFLQMVVIATVNTYGFFNMRQFFRTKKIS